MRLVADACNPALAESKSLLQRLALHGTTGRMDKTLRKYTSFDEAKADEYRYWQSRPAHERMDAISEITQDLYAMKGEVPDVPRLQRTLVHLKRSQG